MDFSFLIPSLFFSSILGSVFLALWMNEKFEKQNEDVLSYAWGYFNGIYIVAGSFLFPMSAYLLLSFLIDEEEYTSDWLSLAIIGIFLTPIAWGIIKRYKLAWGIYILASAIFMLWGFYVGSTPGIFSIIVLYINIKYAKNRWHEFIPM